MNGIVTKTDYAQIRVSAIFNANLCNQTISRNLIGSIAATRRYFKYLRMTE